MSAPLPPPTGKHAVARTALEWTDPHRPERYGDNPRRLVTWVWYPSEPAAERADYLPEAWRPTAEMIGVATKGMVAHSRDGGPLAGDHETYPVVLFSPSGFPPLLFSGVTEDLASHGYVVVGVNHTYETAVTVFADGRVVPMNPEAIAGALGPPTGPPGETFARRAEVCRYKAADLAFIADRLPEIFPGRLDLDRISAAGHSFGGNAALQWCRDDPRCRAAVNLDGALWTEVGELGLDKPALQILAPHPELQQADDAEARLSFAGWATVGRTHEIPGATHLSFMDVPFLPLAPQAMAAGMLAATTIEPAEMRRTTNALLLEFLSSPTSTPGGR
jgi:predicted dienelactone hydrolase